MEGVLKITKIRIRYQIRIPSEGREKTERALAVYAEKCPAYQTVRNCIEVSWTAQMEEI